MRKFSLVLIAIVVLVAMIALSHETRAASDAVGSTPRDPTLAFPNESNFTNLAVTGNDKTGIPGYIKLYSMDAGNNVIARYLWFDKAGNLRTASQITMVTYASFPDVSSWDVTAGDMGSKVGAQ